VKTQLKGRWSFVLALALITVISFAAFSIIWQASLNSPMAVDRETLFQVSPFNTFSSGDYTGYMTFDELAKHGDFGIGTFDGLDGEMLALSGVFHQIPSDGKPNK